MTTQNISFTFVTDNLNVTQSGAGKGSDEKGGFNRIISSKTQDVNNNKSVKTTDNTKTSGKLNVVNDKSSIISMDGNKIKDIDAKDVELINVYLQDGRLQMQLISDSFDYGQVIIDIDGLLEDIKAMIADIMNVSEGEVEEVLEQNGLTMMDIFVSQNLQTLFVGVSGIEDFSQILTNDNANKMWAQLSEAIEGIEIQLNQDIVLNSEQFAALIQTVINQEEQIAGEEVIGDISAGVAEKVIADELIDDASDTNEPQVIINNEMVSVSETSDNDQNDLFNQNSGYREASDTIRDDDTNDINSTITDDRVGESLFSQFMDKVEAAVTQDAPQAVEYLQQMREIANQVIEGVRVNVRPDITGFEIQLNPEHLGKVNVSIQMKDGVAMAHFAVKDEMARVALENQMQSLKDTFENQGLKVESIEVTVSDFSFKQSDNSWTNGEQRKEGNRRRFRSDEELEQNSNYVISSEDVSVNAAEDGGINIRA